MPTLSTGLGFQSSIRPLNNALPNKLANGVHSSADLAAVKLYDIEILYPNITSTDMGTLFSTWNTNKHGEITTPALSDGNTYTGLFKEQPVVNSVNYPSIRVTVRITGSRD